MKKHIPTQNDNGRAFEYGIAAGFSEYLDAPVRDSVQIRTAKRCFIQQSEKEKTKIVKASKEIVAFLVAHDNRLTESNCEVSLQSDQKGEKGDVRDVIIHNTKLKKEIGISAKNRNYALKHSRLSEDIDFGTDWFGVRCSQKYFHQVTPVFREMRTKQRKKINWEDIPNKMQLFYMPIPQAFQTEILSLFENKSVIVAEALLRYLLGRYDHYKIIKENGDISVTSFNIGGTLKWGSRLRLPTEIITITLKPKTETTLIMVFNNGWQLSFRIHNASKIVEPSLKFDITIVGSPAITRHVIRY